MTLGFIHNLLDTSDTNTICGKMSLSPGVVRRSKTSSLSRMSKSKSMWNLSETSRRHSSFADRVSIPIAIGLLRAYRGPRNVSGAWDISSDRSSFSTQKNPLPYGPSKYLGYTGILSK